MVNVEDTTQIGCAVINCKILHQLKIRNDEYEKLNARYTDVQNHLEKIQETLEMKKPDEGSLNELLSSNMKLTSENGALKADLEKTKSEKKVIVRQLEEAKMYMDKTQEEFCNFKTKYDLDKDISERRKQIIELEKQIKLKDIEFEKLNRTVIKYKETFEKDLEDTNKSREMFNDMIAKVKLLRIEEEGLKKDICKLRKIDIKQKKHEIRLDKVKQNRHKIRSMFIRKKPVNGELVKYIRDTMSKGYELNVIKMHLDKYGYPKEAVNDAIKEIR